MESCTRIGDTGIGELVVQALTGHNSPAVLLKNHGVFTIGASARDAVKAAIMCEDAARTVAIAESLGKPEPIPANDVAALHARYQNVYGQR